MSRVLTTSKLVDSVRKRAMIPKDTSVFTDDNIVEILNEEIDTNILAKLMSVNEEHMVTFIDVALEDDKNNYTIPYRSVGNKLRDLAALDSAGDFYELSRISLEEVSDYRSPYVVSNDDVFYIEGDEVKLVDFSIRDYKTLRFYIYLRPSVLVPEDEVAVVTAIDTATGTVSLDKFPKNFSTNNVYDLVSKRTPNKILKFDIKRTASDANVKTITFSPSDMPEGLAIGDYVCVAEQSPVPNIPTEWHPVLAQSAAVYILESLGDSEGLQNAYARLQKMEEAVMQITDDRVEGAPNKINARHSTLNESVSRTRRFRRRF
jgi:hypothetical protein